MKQTEDKCIKCKFRSRAADTLNEEELLQLSKNCYEVPLEPDETVIREGTPGNHVAYLRKGLAKVHKTGPKHTDQILKLVLPGYYIGVQTLLSQPTHLYSATTLEPSSVCYIDFSFFKRMLQVNAQFAYELITYISNDELKYFERMINHNQKQVSGRLADTILYLGDEVYQSSSFTLSLSRKDLAALVCSTRETLTRALFELHNTNVLKVDNKHIEIISRDMLQKISRNG